VDSAGGMTVITVTVLGIAAKRTSEIDTVYKNSQLQLQF
jgi:hypothetical protein